MVANLAASVLHFGDNIFHFHQYPEPTWIRAPHVVDALWFVMTPLLAVGWWLASRPSKWAAVSVLWLYGALSMCVLGHYLYAVPTELPFRINVFIMAEALAAALLIAFAPFLLSRRGGRQTAGHSPRQDSLAPRSLA
jgi:hypothetical protein